MFKKAVSTCLTVLLLLGLAMTFPAFGSPSTTVSVINATPGATDYGTTIFNFSNEYPPPVPPDYYYGQITANITVTDVSDLAGWQLNLTWDSTMLDLRDISRPSDAIFGATGMEGAKTIDPGKVFWTCTRGAGQPAFTGNGRMCQIIFNVTRAPGLGDPPLTCSLTLDQVSPFPTALSDSIGTAISYTPEDGLYEFWYIFYVPKPHLEVYVASDTVEQGLPMGPTIIGTPKENFTVHAIIDDIAGASSLIAYQIKFVWNSTSGFQFLEANEGPFLNLSTAWAPYGTYFGATGYGDNATHAWFIAIGIINYGLYNTWMPPGPDSTGLPPEDRSLFSVTFKSTLQEQYPWEIYTPNAFCFEPVWTEWPERTFEDKDEGWIEYKPFNQWGCGHYHITGWVTGRMLDIYTQYDYPYGGQGLHMPSDMFWPQKEVILCANVTYNLWPVQNKIVTFEVQNPAGEIVTVLTAVSNEDGVACTSYRIPWPCENPEELFGVWTITGSVDIACEVVIDTLQFHFDYLIRWIKVTVEPESVAHCENVTITVEYKSHAQQTYNGIITVVIHDELNYPIGFVLVPIQVGGAVFCEYKEYRPIVVSLHIPKHAAAGIAKVHVNALSDLPTESGFAWVPEYSPPPEFDIRPEWA